MLGYRNVQQAFLRVAGGGVRHRSHAVVPRRAHPQVQLHSLRCGSVRDGLDGHGGAGAGVAGARVGGEDGLLDPVAADDGHSQARRHW